MKRSSWNIVKSYYVTNLNHHCHRKCKSNKSEVLINHAKYCRKSWLFGISGFNQFHIAEWSLGKASI